MYFREWLPFEVHVLQKSSVGWRKERGRGEAAASPRWLPHGNNILCSSDEIERNAGA